MGDFGKYGLLFILLENNQCVKIFGVCSGNLLQVIDCRATFYFTMAHDGT